jgi:hypothetical protein
VVLNSDDNENKNGGKAFGYGDCIFIQLTCKAKESL